MSSLNEKFKYCKRINNLDNSLFFANQDYYCYGTKVQVSGIYSLTSLVKTGAYWDDIAYLCLMSGGSGNIVLLGSGLLSFVPLLKSRLDRKLNIKCIDLNESIIDISKRIQIEQGASEKVELEFICENAENIPVSILNNTDSLFIDIYNEFNISNIALNDHFLEKLKKVLRSEAIIAININDVNFNTDSACTTRLFFDAIVRHWKNIVVARRKSSTTLLFSLQINSSQIKEKLFSINKDANKDYEFVEDASKVFKVQNILFSNEELFLKFNQTFQEDQLETDSLLYRVISDLKSLTTLDVIKLIKKGNQFGK